MGEVFPLPLNVKIMVVGCEKYIFHKNRLLYYQIVANSFFSLLYVLKLENCRAWINRGVRGVCWRRTCFIVRWELFCP